jgi:hypothetical protein
VDFLNTYKHNSVLQAIITLLLISTIHISQHPLCLFQPAVSSPAVSWQRFLTMKILQLHALKFCLHSTLIWLIPRLTAISHQPLYLFFTGRFSTELYRHWKGCDKWSWAVIYYPGNFLQGLKNTLKISDLSVSGPKFEPKVFQIRVVSITACSNLCGNCLSFCSYIRVINFILRLMAMERIKLVYLLKTRLRNMLTVWPLDNLRKQKMSISFSKRFTESTFIDVIKDKCWDRPRSRIMLTRNHPLISDHL